jgi:hypothetical protein
MTDKVYSGYDIRAAFEAGFLADAVYANMKEFVSVQKDEKSAWETWASEYHPELLEQKAELETKEIQA